MTILEQTQMQVDLEGRSFRAIGAEHKSASAVAEALMANGARLSPTAAAPDILVVSYPVLPDEEIGENSVLMRQAEAIGREMAKQSGGRIIVLLSALAAMPMRRHPRYSAQMAAVAVGMRGLAMQLGPTVLVNGVGAGVIEGGRELLSGDVHMLTHASLGRPGGLAELTNAVLFLADPLNSYTTGQLLAVDGGWTAGYGRNF